MNDVNIIGYINSKPNMKQKDERTAVNFLISPRHKKGTPEDYIPCVVFGKYAESVFPYIHKGDMVAVSGRLSGRYVSEDNSIIRASVVINSIEFLKEGKQYSDTPAPEETEEESFTSNIDERVMYGALNRGGD